MQFKKFKKLLLLRLLLPKKIPISRYSGGNFAIYESQTRRNEREDTYRDTSQKMITPYGRTRNWCISHCYSAVCSTRVCCVFHGCVTDTRVKNDATEAWMREALPRVIYFIRTQKKNTRT